MNQKYGFTQLTLPDFRQWLKDVRVSRTITRIQQHHTYSPSYTHFTGTNHFELQRSMRDYHVNANGWNTIGQHFTIFPDGTILTGRALSLSPACIYGQNANAICIENLGNFDLGADTMHTPQRESIVTATALMCEKFNIPITADYIVYHHWFDLKSGARNNGARNNKSCPGTNFFGGNKVAHCQVNFLPLVVEAQTGTIKTDDSDVLKYVGVTANTLNVRVGPGVSNARAADTPAVVLGTVLRVYEERDGWLKISKSSSRWVSARYTSPVQKAIVTALALNVRTGPGTRYPRSGSLSKGETIFIAETEGNWCRIAFDDKWVSKQYLDFVG